MKRRIMVILLVLSISFVPLASSTVTGQYVAHAAFGNVQVEIVTQSPIVDLLVMGLNQDWNGARFTRSYDADWNVRSVKTVNWWWAFTYHCYYIFDCLVEFPSPDELGVGIFATYSDGHTEYSNCTKEVSRFDDWVTCPPLTYVVPDEPGEGGGGGTGGETPPDGDSDGDGVPDSRDNCPSLGDEGYGVDANGCPIPPPPDLRIEIVHVTQSVLGADINNDGRDDFVKDKAIAVFVQPYVDTPDRLTNDQKVTIRIDADYNNGASTQLIYNGSITVSDILSDDVMSFTLPSGPSFTGNVTFQTTIDGDNSIEELNESNNTAKSEGDVKNTRNIAMIAIPLTFNYDEKTSVGSMAKANSQFDLMFDAFPLSPQTWDTGSLSMNSTTNGGAEGRIRSFGEIKRLAAKNYGSYQRYVVYVPQEYVNYYDAATWAGWTYMGIFGQSLVIIKENTKNNTVAHEIMHSYGIAREGYKDNTPDKVDSGYRVADANGTTLPENMTGAYEFMWASTDFAWIRIEDYEHLFRKFRTNIFDPEMLTLTGYIHSDGRVEWQGIDFIPEGVPDEIESNDAVTFLDINGNEISSVPLGISYQLGETIYESGAFATKVLFPDEAVYMEVSLQEEVLTKVNVHTALLRQMVETFPDSAFNRRPDQRRRALLNQLDAIDIQYDHANLNGTINHLYEFQARLDDWLADDYEVESVLLYTKADALAMLDELIERMENVQAIKQTR